MATYIPVCAGVIGEIPKISGEPPPKDGCLTEVQINQAEEGQRVICTEGPACEERPKAKSTSWKEYCKLFLE